MSCINVVSAKDASSLVVKIPLFLVHLAAEQLLAFMRANFSTSFFGDWLIARKLAVLFSFNLNCGV